MSGGTLLTMKRESERQLGGEILEFCVPFTWDPDPTCCFARRGLNLHKHLVKIKIILHFPIGLN
jgi:hypothetical protein